MAINKPDVNAMAVRENGKLTQVYFRLLAAIVDALNTSPVTLDNAGSPEGVVTGRFKDQCWDTVGSKLYFKSTTAGNTGWVALN